MRISDAKASFRAWTHHGWLKNEGEKGKSISRAFLDTENALLITPRLQNQVAHSSRVALGSLFSKPVKHWSSSLVGPRSM